MNRVAVMISNEVIPKSVDSRVGFSHGISCCTLEKNE